MFYFPLVNNGVCLDMKTFGAASSTVSRSSGGPKSADLDTSAMSISSQEDEGNSSAITLDSQDDLEVNLDEDTQRKEMEVVVFKNIPLKLINCTR